MKIEQLSVYIYRWVGTTCMYTFLHSCALISLSIYMYLSVDIHEGYLCILPVLELMCDECILCFEWKVYCMEIASARKRNKLKIYFWISNNRIHLVGRMWRMKNTYRLEIIVFPL